MNDSCTLAIHLTQNGYVFRIDGRGTMHESASVRDFISGAIEDGVDVVLDLSACEYLDSTFLGCLVLLHQRSKSHKGTFSVFADESARNRLLASVQLHRYLDFTEESPECLGEPVSLHVSKLDRAEFGQHLLATHRKLAELGGPSAETFKKVADEIARELDEGPL